MLSPRATNITLGAPASPTAEDSFWYDPDSARFLEHAIWNDGTTGASWTLYLMGGGYEATFPVSDANVTERDQVQVTKTVVQRHTVNSDNSTSDVVEYDYRNHQGSISVIADTSGNVIDNLAYDPFGGRRASDWGSDITPTALQQIETGNTTDRGYTDHEHLDRIGLIHMNGRIYDPRLGRFLQPDPILQGPSSSQNYNRYAYVFNNPESYTDPRGFAGSCIHNDYALVCPNIDDTNKVVARLRQPSRP